MVVLVVGGEALVRKIEGGVMRKKRRRKTRTR